MRYEARGRDRSRTATTSLAAALTEVRASAVPGMRSLSANVAAGRLGTGHQPNVRAATGEG